MSKTIIIGANFAGLAAAKEIGTFTELTLVDPSPYFEFIPNIHELISKEKSPSNLRLDKGELIQNMGHNWIQDKVVSLKPEENQVELSNGQKLNYDACILAIGGVNDFREVPGASEFAYPFKSVDNCQIIGDRFQTLRNEQSTVSIVIVGGGSEGVEALGELLRFRNEANRLKIHLVEPEPRLLPSLSSKVSREILRICRDLPVEFHLGTRIEEVFEDTVRLSNGEVLQSDLTIWTGGVKPNPLLFEAKLANSDDTWGAVKSTLQSSKYKNVFVAGDAAAIRSQDSKQAYFAIESGKIAGQNVSRFLRKSSFLKTFHPISRPYLYSFGDLSCFLIYDHLAIAGNPLGTLKEGIYKKTMIDFQTADTHMRVLEFYEEIMPLLIKEFGKGLSAFFSSPLDFLLRPAVQILH